MTDHLVGEHGYSREEAYALTSVGVNLHISEHVDVPNMTVSAFPGHFCLNATRGWFLNTVLRQ